ncbi:MAG: Tol-Pal system beta propeller repeat protein TolB [Sphingomicrobium sp.]
MILFRIPKLPAAAILLLAGTAALAQEPEPTAQVIAIPPLATAKVTDTDAGTTWGLANQIANLITADLKLSSKFIFADIQKVRIPSYPEVTAPSYLQWRSAGAKLLLQGFVNARSDGRLTIGCYLYDVQTGRELARQGFAVSTGEWRRAAHKCADMAYQKATGNAPMFDSRIAYVAESGSGDSLVKRLAVMDFDGANHTWLTSGDSTVLTPKWSPDGSTLAYTSFSGGKLHVQVAEVGSSADRPLLPGGSENFSPAFSPDGNTIAVSMSNAGNVDLYAVPASGGFPRRLTTSPAIDTSPSYSPDGKSIAFVSDRSGSPQIYVMNADGSNERRISFGAGAYGSPAWSPAGDRISFMRTEGPISRIGIMGTDGSSERVLTNGPSDEEPTWSPDGSRVLFQRVDPGSRRTLLATVPAAGGEVKPVPTPQSGSDPSWSERQE